MNEVVTDQKIYELVSSPLWHSIIKPYVTQIIDEDTVTLRSIKKEQLDFYQGKIAGLQDLLDNMEKTAEDIVKGSKDAD